MNGRAALAARVALRALATCGIVLPAISAQAASAPADAASPQGSPQLAAPPQGSPQMAASPQGSSQIEVRLVSQAPWVTPGQPFALRMHVDSKIPPSRLVVSETLYSSLDNRSTLESTFSSGRLGRLIAQTPPVPLSSLPPEQGGTYDIAFVPTLSCVPAQCSGVYPFRVSVEEAGASSEHASLVTYLVYSALPSETQKVRVALVFPLGIPNEGADANGNPVVTSRSLSSLDALIGAIGARPDVPLTLVPDPGSLDALAASARPPAHGIVSELAALSADPNHQVLAQSQAPVDPASLVDGGLSSELTAQVGHGQAELAAFGVKATSEVWADDGGVNAAALDDLSSLGFGRFVVPESSVTEAASRLSQTQPVELVGGKGQVHLAALSDTGLDSELTNAQGPDATIDAYRFLAELAVIYFEAPNLTSPRGVVAVAPPAWSPDASFVSTLLGALPADPMVVPVNLQTFFGSVPIEAGAPRRELPASSPAIAVKEIRLQRARLDAFASALGPAGASELRSLEGLLLDAESDLLGAGGQQAALVRFTAALSSQLTKLQIATVGIRLTSSAANVPITVLRNVPYPITAILRISSDKLVFPATGVAGGPSTAPSGCRAPAVGRNGGQASFSCTTSFDHSTNVVYVDMKSRSSGDFRMTVTLTSPKGGLVLAASRLTVRSTAISAISIALSAISVAVLGAWWGRTLWRGTRGRRRGSHTSARSRTGRTRSAGT